ncbi:MAG: flagellar biosynthesis protein FlgN [Rhodobacteraceae bacterium]|nr:flagellar biosynthesis protein FlgN [Paracoccaceae bacterium]
MVLFNIPSVVDALDDLLDRERQAILTGNLDALSRQLVEKTRLLERLAGSTDDAARIERLRVKTDRNQELLGAVARGIKSVSQRLEAMKNPDTTLRTYDEGGAHQNLRTRKSSMEKRA